MRIGLLFKLVKWSRAVRIALGGFRHMEARHYLFQLSKLPSIEELYKRLIPLCFTYNREGTAYRNQVFQVRKLTSTMHQIHLRAFVFNGVMVITGHYEIQQEQDLWGHLKGRDLRELTEEEIQLIKKALSDFI